MVISGMQLFLFGPLWILKAESQNIMSTNIAPPVEQVAQMS